MESAEEVQSEFDSFLSINGYVRKEKIGEGAYARIYKVYSREYNKEFCVKIYKNNKSHPKEIEILKQVLSGNIVHLYNVLTYRNRTFMIMEYCPNGSLADIVKRKGPFDMNTLKDYAFQIANAIKEIHSKDIAHLDIKPHNVLIDAYYRLKLSDFGSGVIMRKDKHCEKFVGTVHYMAPEIYNRQSFDPFAADMWSFGILLYYLATGTYPWGSQSLIGGYFKAALSGVIYFNNIRNVKFIDLVRGCLNARPSNRYNIDTVLSHPFFSSNENIVSSKCFASSTLSAMNRRSSFNSPVSLKRASTVRSIRVSDASALGSILDIV